MSRKHKPAPEQNQPGVAAKTDAPELNNEKPKAQYRIRNWAEYNQNLKKRGDITLWISDDVIAAWRPDPMRPKKRGGQQEYSDVAIECLLTVKAVFDLAYRQTEGFANSLNMLLEIDLPIPDYTTLNRRAKTLQVSVKATAKKGPIHVVVDSTGLKVYGEGEWKVRKHGASKRRTWRKLHLGVDEASGEIEAQVLTDAATDDAEVTEQLLEATQAKVEQVSGDGAYDKDKVYKAMETQGVDKVTIPPRKDAVLWPEKEGQAHPRNTNLRRIQEIGQAAWKVECGYHRRSLAETAMFRFKTIFGDRLSAREKERQKIESAIKCAALNRMTQLGMPDSYRIG
jgi:IS5 family transposase